MVNIKPHIIIQARMGSTRLPSKVMRKIIGKPMIGHQIERLKQTNLPIIVATSISEENNELVEYLKSIGVNVFRGSEDNVLKRYYEAAKHFKAKQIIRITGDNPLIDPVFILEQLKNINIQTNRYYVSDISQKDLPLGMAFEMFPFSILEEAYINAVSKYEKEHVTPYLHQNIPGNIINYNFITSISNMSSYRLTVDTELDFNLIEILINEYDCINKSVFEIIKILEEHSYLKEINSKVIQKKWND